MLRTAPAPTAIEGYDVLRSETADLEAAFVPRAGNVMVSIADAGHVCAELEYAAHGEQHAASRFPHRLTVDATLRGRTLTIATVLEPAGLVAVPVAFGFRPSLRVPGVRRRHWFAELPALRRLELDARGRPTGRGAPQRSWCGVLGARTFDDAFTGVRPGTAFAVSGAGRRIQVILGEGFPCAQVLAPVDDDVVCFGPMTAPPDALRTGDDLAVCAPGDAYAATFSITVDRHMP
jgi:aldose 1-epimerase